VPAAARKFGPARIAFGVGLLPTRIEQGPWVVDYADWKADAVSGLPMPGRINAERGEDRVRLVVDRWDVPLE
jgi:outer membrane lipoprotein LolB